MEQKISKYSTATIVSLLCLLFSLPLQAQQQRPGARPAVKQKAKEEIKADTIPFYNGTYVGVDLFGLGSKLLGGDFLSSEVNVRVNLKKKFIPTVEIGFGQTDTWSDTGIHYKSAAPYFRVGADYNVVKEYLYVGLCYGFSSFKYDISSTPFSDPIYGGSMANPGLIDGIWGGSVPYHYNGLKSNMQWLELVAGVNVQIYKSFYMGWTLRFKFKTAGSISEHGNPWYVPGFGEYDSSNIGITYTLIYKLPF